MGLVLGTGMYQEKNGEAGQRKLASAKIKIEEQEAIELNGCVRGCVM